jgi:CO/xanthine dehydrogenase Mo-binding subunit
VFNDAGQLLNASLADYLLLTELDLPRIDVAHHVTPSPLNPLGVKGVGEAGAIPVGAAIAQAIEDALDLPRNGVALLAVPLSPHRLWELSQARCKAAE